MVPVKFRLAASMRRRIPPGPESQLVKIAGRLELRRKQNQDRNPPLATVQDQSENRPEVFQPSWPLKQSSYFDITPLEKLCQISLSASARICCLRIKW